MLIWLLAHRYLVLCTELALYVLPRAADSLFVILRNHRWLSGLPHGEMLLFALSSAAVMYFMEYEKDTVSPLLYKLFRQFFPLASKSVVVHNSEEASEPRATPQLQDGEDR